MIWINVFSLAGDNHFTFIYLVLWFGWWLRQQGIQPHQVACCTCCYNSWLPIYDLCLLSFQGSLTCSLYSFLSLTFLLSWLLFSVTLSFFSMSIFISLAACSNRCNTQLLLHGTWEPSHFNILISSSPHDCTSWLPFSCHELPSFKIVELSATLLYLFCHQL